MAFWSLRFPSNLFMMDFPITKIKGGVSAAKGFLTSAVSCGIKNPASDRLDLALIYSEKPCRSAGTFTTNKVKAAPVKVTQSHLKKESLRAVVVNSGNANACTGLQGLHDATAMCEGVARELRLKKTQVGVCSTGVIGLPMPMVRLEPNIEDLVTRLAVKQGNHVARAIITSDTHEKEIAISFDMGEYRVRIGGCVKGAGMISPSMATMLCFITTDANLSQDCLQKAVQESVEESFNRITIDGDMSTNDTVIVLANGASGMPLARRGGSACRQFRQALGWVMLELAKAVVRDGERVTKFVTVNVKGASTHLDAKKVAEAVCKSALVKSSWNGGDPNWGRVLAAVGTAGAQLNPLDIDVTLNGIKVAQSSAPFEDRNKVSFSERLVTIKIDLKLGNASATVFTNDLSHDYVHENSAYAT
jgi:glutamate N-acetyltransferase/amino-acid N-acetyltransferase